MSESASGAELPPPPVVHGAPQELAPGVWQDTELLLWKPPAAWFSINAFYTPAGMRNWYVNFEHPTTRPRPP